MEGCRFDIVETLTPRGGVLSDSGVTALGGLIFNLIASGAEASAAAGVAGPGTGAGLVDTGTGTVGVAPAPVGAAAAGGEEEATGATGTPEAAPDTGPGTTTGLSPEAGLGGLCLSLNLNDSPGGSAPAGAELGGVGAGAGLSEGVDGAAGIGSAKRGLIRSLAGSTPEGGGDAETTSEETFAAVGAGVTGGTGLAGGEGAMGAAAGGSAPGGCARGLRRRGGGGSSLMKSAKHLTIRHETKKIHSPREPDIANFLLTSHLP